MILKENILNVIKDLLKEKEIFLVSLDINASNNIRLVIDSMKGVTLSECVQLNRAIEKGLNRNHEDFNIEVTSPGLGTPFKVREQYVKNIGKEVEVILKTGQKVNGMLIQTDDNNFIIEQDKQVRIEGEKKMQRIKERVSFFYGAVSKVKNVIKF